MFKRILAAAAVFMLVSGPAFAAHCPKDVKAIDAALKSGKVSGSAAAKVKALRDEGEALHKAGKHGDSTNKLSEAMRMILNGM